MSNETPQQSGQWLDEYWRQKREHQGLRQERTRKIEASLNGHSRSELVHRAMTSEGNRFRLAHLTIKAARRFHVETERMETTISDSLRRIGNAKPLSEPGRDNASLGSCAARPMTAEGPMNCATEGQDGASNDLRAAC